MLRWLIGWLPSRSGKLRNIWKKKKERNTGRTRSNVHYFNRVSPKIVCNLKRFFQQQLGWNSNVRTCLTRSFVSNSASLSSTCSMENWSGKVARERQVDLPGSCPINVNTMGYRVSRKRKRERREVTMVVVEKRCNKEHGRSHDIGSLFTGYDPRVPCSKICTFLGCKVARRNNKLFTKLILLPEWRATRSRHGPGRKVKYTALKRHHSYFCDTEIRTKFIKLPRQFESSAEASERTKKSLPS